MLSAVECRKPFLNIWIVAGNIEGQIIGSVVLDYMRLVYKGSNVGMVCLKNRARCSGSRLYSQHFGRPRWVDHEAKRSRPSWSTWWNPVSTKNTKKLAGCGNTCLQSQLHRRLKQENHLNLGGGGCSEPRSCNCTPAWATRVKLHLKNKKNKKRKCLEVDHDNGCTALWIYEKPLKYIL